MNIESEAKRLTKEINTLGSDMMEKIKYFYHEGYKTVVLHEVLHSAIDMDRSGVRLVLHYVHPKFLLLFLKRKEMIDKQIYGYVSSYEMSSNRGNIEMNISVLGDFFKGDKGLFLDFNTYFQNIKS